MSLEQRISPSTKLSIIEFKRPTVYIHQDALNKINVIIDNGGKDEVGWLATAQKIDTNYLIKEVFIPKQDVHATTTEINVDGLGELMTELLEDKEHGLDRYNDLRCWGHSHVNMGVTPSGQDESQMKLFSDNKCDWFIRMIGNKKGELKVDIFDYKNGIQLTDVPWRTYANVATGAIQTEINELYNKIDELEQKFGEIVQEQEKSITESVKKEIEEKVKPKYKTYGYNRSNNYGVYGYQDDEYYGGYSGYSKKKESAKKSIRYPVNFNNVNEILTEEEIVEIGKTLDYEKVVDILTPITGAISIYAISEVRKVCKAYVESLSDAQLKVFQ